MPRPTHFEVVSICNKNLTHQYGFPLALANTAANMAYSDAITMLENMLVELKKLHCEQSIPLVKKNIKSV